MGIGMGMEMEMEKDVVRMAMIRTAMEVEIGMEMEMEMVMSRSRRHVMIVVLFYCIRWRILSHMPLICRGTYCFDLPAVKKRSCRDMWRCPLSSLRIG